MTPSISIIICTRDRASDLRQTLESIGRTSVPAGWEVELVVVDNGSTDATEATVKAFELPNMPIRYVKEPRRGKSNALNTGILAAQGRILLCTDDDIRVPKSWIAGLCWPIVDGKSDAVAGGIIFPPHVAYALSLEPYNSRRGWFASSEYLNPDRPASMIGANMAFDRRVLEKVPGFDPELGVGALGMEEETLFSKQLLAAGYRLLGALDVAVDHHFDLTRMSRAGMLDIARKKGRSDAFVFYHWEHQRSRLIVPRLLVFQLRKICIQFLDIFRRNKQTVVSGHALRVEEKLAFCREYIIQRRRTPKYSRYGLAPLANPTSR